MLLPGTWSGWHKNCLSNEPAVQVGASGYAGPPGLVARGPDPLGTGELVKENSFIARGNGWS